VSFLQYDGQGDTATMSLYENAFTKSTAFNTLIKRSVGNT